MKEPGILISGSCLFYQLESIKMSFKPYQIYVIDAVNSEKSSYLQDIVFASLLQSAWTNKPKILSVKLESAIDWMPAGNIQVQGFGPLQIMYSYEEDMTEDVILTMGQICITVQELFKDNPILARCSAFDSDENDAELNEMFLSIQYEVGKIKYNEMKFELFQTELELEKIATEFRNRSNISAEEIVSHYKTFCDDIIQTATSSGDTNEISLIQENFDSRRSVIEKEVEADKVATKALQNPLLIKTAVFGFFANRVAVGYGIPQETEVDICGTASIVPSRSSSDC